MKKTWFMLVFAVLLTSACVMTTGPQGTTVAVAPALPVVVDLYEPYYVHGGYFYYYSNNRWYYSNHRSGPWIDLPRDRYPREVRHRGRGQGPGWR